MGLGLWTVSLNGESEPDPQLFFDAPSNQWGATFSPDGNWLAYSSLESAGLTVFVQPFPPTGRLYRITEAGNSVDPIWSADGTELIYHRLESNRIVAVDVTTVDGFSFEAGRPMPIEGFLSGGYRNWDQTPDRQRFLVTFPSDQAEAGVAIQPQREIRIVTNWFEELKERVPVP